MIEIEKNIPIPEKRYKKRKYPVLEMEVGDSFFAPDITPSSITGVLQECRGKGWEFVRRTEKTGARVWRTK